MGYAQDSTRGVSARVLYLPLYLPMAEGVVMIACRVLIAVGVLMIGVTIQAEEWTQFRGPGGLGVGVGAGLPTDWSSSRNLLWRAELPGAGSSSPVIVGDRLFLTCYSGYAQSVERPGNLEDLMRHIVCLSRDDGRVLWQKDIQPEAGESRYQGTGSRHGYSSSTPTSDGERVYFFLGTSGVFCFDLDGTPVWRTRVGSGVHKWGSSNSPVLYKNLLLINASVESRRLVALDKLSGKEVWSADRIRGSWNTPLLVAAGSGKTEIVLCEPRRVLGYDPQTGNRLWTCEGIPDKGYVCPSGVAHDGVVYLIGGRQNTAMAVRAGGRGDVTTSHRLWVTGKGSNVSSPVYHAGHLYWVHESRGVAYCLDAATGDVVYEERLAPRPGRIYSSATLVDGKLYCVSQHMGTYVLAAKPEFELLAHNTFDDDSSRTNAIPVVSRGQLLLRSDKYLYCVGAK